MNFSRSFSELFPQLKNLCSFPSTAPPSHQQTCTEPPPCGAPTCPGTRTEGTHRGDLGHAIKNEFAKPHSRCAEDPTFNQNESLHGLCDRVAPRLAVSFRSLVLPSLISIRHSAGQPAARSENAPTSSRRTENHSTRCIPRPKRLRLRRCTATFCQKSSRWLF